MSKFLVYLLLVCKTVERLKWFGFTSSAFELRLVLVSREEETVLGAVGVWTGQVLILWSKISCAQRCLRWLVDHEISWTYMAQGSLITSSRIIQRLIYPLSLSTYSGLWSALGWDDLTLWLPLSFKGFFVFVSRFAPFFLSWLWSHFSARFSRVFGASNFSITFVSCFFSSSVRPQLTYFHMIVLLLFLFDFCPWNYFQVCTVLAVLLDLDIVVIGTLCMSLGLSQELVGGWF